MELLEITDDLFDVSSRLRSVKESYKTFYNRKLRRYEIHDGNQKGSTLAFVVPYESLDARTVEYARYTSASNAETVFKDIEKHNGALEKASVNRTEKELKNILKEASK